jgi:hypothetical protein
MNTLDYWKNRRYMAWLSLLMGLIGYPGMCLYDPGLLALSSPIYLFVGTTVGLYKWTAMVDDKDKRVHPNA